MGIDDFMEEPRKEYDISEFFVMLLPSKSLMYDLDTIRAGRPGKEP